MKHILLIPFLCLVQLAVAQKDSTSTKLKNHSIGLYTGANAFEEYRIGQKYQDNTRQTIIPYTIPSFFVLSNLFSISYKYKKHEIIPVLYLANYYTDNNKSKLFVLGGSLSYLYHFSQKRAHFFFEANLQTFSYTIGSDGKDIRPYGTSQQPEWTAEQFHAAKIQTYILNPAMGIEVKLWPLTYLQFAYGCGAYYLKGAPVTPAATAAQFGTPDWYQNTYPGVFGLNWYARLSIIVRVLNF